MDEKDTKSKGCCNRETALKVFYLLLAVLIIVVSLALIAVSISSAIVSKVYLPSEMSGRLVALIILAVTAAIALSMVIYAIIAIIRKKLKPCHITSVVLIILVVIQVIIAGVSVHVTQKDEFALEGSLLESFALAKEESPRNVKIWATTQHDLQCCGFFSAEDYRRNGVSGYFPPDVPISCCPGYDPDRSELVQERAREVCKARKEFFGVGCKSMVLEVFSGTSVMVLTVAIILILLEIIEAVLGSVMYWEEKKKGLNSKEAVEDGPAAKK